MPPNTREEQERVRNLIRFQRQQRERAMRNASRPVVREDPVELLMPPGEGPFVPFPLGWWQDLQGRWIRLTDMSDTYLNNCIRYVSQRNRGTAMENQLRNEVNRRREEQIRREVAERQMEHRRRIQQAPIMWTVIDEVPEIEPETPLPDRVRRIRE